MIEVGDQQMTKTAFLGVLGKMGFSLAKAARWAPSVNLYGARHALSTASKTVGRTGIFKGKTLPSVGKLSRNITKAHAERGLSPIYTPKGLGQRIIGQPAAHLQDIKTHGVKRWAHNQLLKGKYHVNTKTGVITRRSLGGTLTSPLTSGGALAGTGMGGFDLATGSTPGKAARSAVGWGLAPNAMVAKDLGQMGFNLLK